MIRIDYPARGPMTQFRQRLHLATRRTRRALEERRRALRALADARSAARDDYLRLRWRQDLARERRTYEALSREHDALVGVLCAAAHEGLQPGMEDDYKTLRAWFCIHYPEAKRALSVYLEYDPSDGVTGRFGRRSCDAVEALFFPPSIAAMLASDGGNLIGRLVRIQEALAAWQKSIARREAAAGGNAGTAQPAA